MEMCYNGSLVMPGNYAVVSEEEMTYVVGGWSSTTYGTLNNIKWRVNGAIAVCIAGDACALGMGVCGGVVIGGIFGCYFTDSANTL